MPRATKVLPDNYEPAAALDFSCSRLALVVLSLGGVVVLVVAAMLLLAFLSVSRPGVSLSFAASGWDLLLASMAALAVVALVAVVHELIHGVGFWLATREQPRYRFRGYYASAGAPAWYIPVSQYLPIGLAPIVVVTLVGLVLLRVVAPPVIPTVLLAVAFNAAGAVGDLAAVAWLATKPRNSVVCDTGDRIELYTVPRAKAH